VGGAGGTNWSGVDLPRWQVQQVAGAGMSGTLLM